MLPMLYLNLVLNNLDSVPTGELISLAKQINQVYGNPCMQSRRINLVKNAVKIQIQERKIKVDIKGKKTLS